MSDGNGHRGASTAATTTFFDDPIPPLPPAPAPEAVHGTHEAFVQQRLVEIHDRQRRRINARALRLGRRTAAVQGLRVRLALHRRSLLVAARENSRVHEQPVPPRGLAFDGHSRALGTVALVVVLAVCVLADYLVDRGSLQVLRLPLRLTQVLALLVAVVQTMSAHAVGRLLRRQSEAVDPGALRHERTKMRVLIVFIAVTVAGLAVLRGLLGTLVFGVMILAVGGAAAVVAVTASYLHASTRLDALGATARRLRREGWAATRVGRRLVRAQARQAVAASDLRATAAAVVAQVDVVYATHSPPDDGGEPPWVVEMRRWARGEDLPGEPAHPVHEEQG